LPDDFAVGNIQRGDGFVFQADEDALPIAGVGALPDSLGRRERPPGRARFEVEGEKRTARGGKDDRPADNQRRVIDRAVGLGRPREGEVVVQRGFAGLRGTAEDGQQEVDKARIPVKYLANLFSAGDEETIRRILRKIYAVRIYMRRKTVDKNIDEATLQALTQAGCGPEEADAIYKLTTLPTVPERFVLPPYHREMSVETWKDPLAQKGEVGFGYVQPPQRGE